LAIQQGIAQRPTGSFYRDFFNSPRHLLHKKGGYMKKAIIPIMILGVCVANASASSVPYRNTYYTTSDMVQRALRRTPQKDGIPRRAYNYIPSKSPNSVKKDYKWYIDFGLGFGYATAESSFDAQDWCNPAGCVNGYWDTFQYPGSNQKRNMGKENPVFASLKFARKYDKFAWGAYGDAGTPASALGLFAEFGNQWLFDLGIGAGHNSIFEKTTVDIRLGVGYAFEITDQLALVSTAFFNYQMASNGEAEGKGYDDEKGTVCYNCWTRGTEVLSYYSGGVKAVLRYRF